MKYKIIGLSTMAVVLVTVLVISFLKTEETNHRYIEHMMAEEKVSCEAHGEDEFCSHLPVIRIDTNNQEIPGKPEYNEIGHIIGYTLAEDGTTSIPAKLNVVNNEKTNNHLTEAGNDMGNISIRVRGHSSRRFEKANYLIKFLNADGTNNPQEFLGMDAHHEWALHGPYLDKTLIRNYMWYNIAGEIMEYSPNVRFCELFIDGEYRGLYLATEMITQGKNEARLDIEVNKKRNTYAGYIIRVDWGETDEINKLYPFAKYTLRTKSQHELVYPNAERITPELKESIKNEISEFEKALYSYDYDNEQYGYKKYIDVDSFVDYFLINEITCNYDAGALSTYLYKDTSGKYKMCVWDFNSACDNYQEQAMPLKDFRLDSGLWYTMFFKDDEFTDRVIERYYELRKTYFSDEYLYGFIDDTIAYLGDAIDRNYEKWGYTFDKEYDLLHPSERNLRSYDEYVTHMKEFLKKRIAFLDENIECLRQYSAESKTKKYNEVSK